MNAIAIGGPFGRPLPDLGETLDQVRDRLAKGLRSLAVAYTNAGLAVINNRIIQAGTAPKLLGWGIGTTPAAVTDTDLQTEQSETLSGGRVSATESRVTGSQTNDTYQLVGTVTCAGAGKTISELGAFDSQSVGSSAPNGHGNMLLHGVFTGIGLSIGDSIAFTATLKQVASVT